MQEVYLIVKINNANNLVKFHAMVLNMIVKQYANLISETFLRQEDARGSKGQ